MIIKIQSPHLNLSQKVESAVHKKFERFTKFNKHILLCDIVLRAEKNSQQNTCTVEARLSQPGQDMFAKESASSFEIAAEKVCMDLENKFRKEKEKKNKKETKAIDGLISESDEDSE